MPDELGPVYDLIVRRLLRGKVVPVLGAGVNLSERPPDSSWERGRYLPSGQELADELAQHIGNVTIDGRDLARVSQYMAALEGEGPLYEELHDVFDADYPPTHLHRFLVRLSRRTREAREAKKVRECMLIVTTNYDDSLERAFTDEDEPYELVTYIARGKDLGRFRHITADGEPTVIERPNEYDHLRLDQRTVIAKIHGAVNRIHGDSFVITEDHYIDYIARLAGLFPVKVGAKLRTSHFLFLGYSLRDWNLRVMLYRLWGEQEGMNFESWAIQDNPDPIDRAAWKKRGVDILPIKVEDFVAAVEERLPPQQEVAAWPP